MEKSKPQRIVFIDVLRAFAIMMMLQGHFVDTLLTPSARDTSSMVYNTWNFMRGLTAPTFFTVTGLVFIYLLLRSGGSLRGNPRIAKGVRRGFMLLGIGYLLKVFIPGLFVGYISPWVWSLDVLHVIGIALLALIGVSLLSERIGVPMWLTYLIAALAIFGLHPYYFEGNWEHLPRFFAHFVTKDFGSNFTVIPWLGYTFFGATLGVLLSKRPQWAFSHVLPMALLALGTTLVFGTESILVGLYESTGSEWILSVANYSYLFWRLGQVFYIMAIFMWVVPRLPHVPELVSKIGSETLTIYGVHYVLLYGTWFGFGIMQAIGYRSLEAIPCAIGAVLFVAFFVLLIRYIEEVRYVVYEVIPDAIKSTFKIAAERTVALVLRIIKVRG